MRMVKVSWVIFRQHLQGLYLPNSNKIHLDAICVNTTFKTFTCIVHELLHHIFNILFPQKLYDFFSLILDITDGNAPQLLYEEDNEVVEVLYEFKP